MNDALAVALFTMQNCLKLLFARQFAEFHYLDLEVQWNQFREDQKNLTVEKLEYIARYEEEYRRLEEERIEREVEKARLEEEERRLKEEMAHKRADEEEEDRHEPKGDADEPDASTVYSEPLSETF
jgi:hypothetical protein